MDHSLPRANNGFNNQDASKKKRVASVPHKTISQGKNSFVPAGASMRLAFCPCAFVEYLDFNSLLGVLMPRYLSQHSLACLTRQGAETLAQRMQGGGPASAERVLVNMVEGKMFAEFRSDSRETLEAWLRTEGMHFDWIVRIEWESRDGKLEIAG
jgi:hypothetical protein